VQVIHNQDQRSAGCALFEALHRQVEDLETRVLCRSAQIWNHGERILI
jgi:hypothetical protein